MALTYTFNPAVLYPLIFEEISRVADTAYTEDGAPLYDMIIPSSRDDAAIERMEKDALAVLLNRLSDIVTVGAETGGTILLSFDVPANPYNAASNVLPFSQEITRFLVLSVCADWCREKYTPAAEGFTQRSLLELSKAIQTLKTTVEPTLTRP